MHLNQLSNGYVLKGGKTSQIRLQLSLSDPLPACHRMEPQLLRRCMLQGVRNWSKLRANAPKLLLPRLFHVILKKESVTVTIQ